VTNSSQILASEKSDFGCKLALQLVDDESGQDMIEYALVAATIGLASVAGVNGLASSVSQYMAIVRVAFENALGGQV
jgi:pilus assembly protein Flp/PilA